MEHKQRPDGALELFVIYRRPRDYPAHFVVRRWFITPCEGTVPTEDFAIADTLEAARAEVPRGLYRLSHQPGEDAVIAETWV